MLSCPNCDTTLRLVLERAEPDRASELEDSVARPPIRPKAIHFTMAGEPFRIDRDQVLDAAKAPIGKAIRVYSVDLPDAAGRSRPVPIKEVVRRALRKSAPRAFAAAESGGRFTAHRARDILTRLGFQVRRRRW